MAQKNKKLELYIHIPFCVRKCLYCDFLSGPGDEETRGRYLEALKREIRGAVHREAVDKIGESEKSAPGVPLQERPVVSVFIGGGTPSLLAGEQIQSLLDTVRQCFLVAEDAEITIEANPGTADFERLCAYRRAGVNRLSLGLQSADDGELRALGRIHSCGEFLETYENARRAGFANINVDIMSALPGQTADSYRATLGKVLSLSPPPEHISAYSLIVEEDTPFYELWKSGRLDLPDEDTERLMYAETERILKEKGYQRYEISNYAREGFACRHNCGYWERTDYLGFGTGAASLIENVRFHNGRELSEYLKDPLACRQEEHSLSTEEQMEEFMFLGLRMMKGVGMGSFRRLFGVSMREIYGGVIEKNIADGLLCCRDGEGREKYLALTKRGIDLSNYCMAQFLLS